MDGVQPAYSVLRWSDVDVIEKIWTVDDVWRENVCNAILVAVAFSDLVCKSHANAIEAVWSQAAAKKTASVADGNARK